ncbi:hypothetical protein BT69DRAFT_1334055 [Atractiella rhizophila]|nr:hypothetical protein BT69DRAFT_1334055 [Atractiella rhizophila]
MSEPSTKRKAEEDLEDTEPKKAKNDVDEEDEESGLLSLARYGKVVMRAVEVEDDLAEIDTANIIEGGRRTRGKVIDFSKDPESAVEDDDEEDDNEGGEEEEEEDDEEDANAKGKDDDEEEDDD